MKKNRLIPFRLTPTAWKLRGVAYDEAEAHYTYEGEELERRLVDIRYDRDPREQARQHLSLDLKYEKVTEYQYDVRLLDLTGRGSDDAAILEVEFKHGRVPAYDYDRARAKLSLRRGQSLERVMLDVDLKHGKITDYEHAKAVIEMDYEGREREEHRLILEKRCGHINEYAYERSVLLLDEEGAAREIALLDLDLKHGKITDREHAKQTATLRDEPWVGVIDDGFDLSHGTNGLFFELDWNEKWIEYLRMEGYGGRTEEEIIEQWFEDTCRTYAAERSGSDEFEPRPGRSNRIDRGNGRADYL